MTALCPTILAGVFDEHDLDLFLTSFDTAAAAIDYGCYDYFCDRLRRYDY